MIKAVNKPRHQATLVIAKFGSYFIPRSGAICMKGIFNHPNITFVTNINEELTEGLDKYFDYIRQNLDEVRQTFCV